MVAINIDYQQRLCQGEPMTIFAKVFILGYLSLLVSCASYKNVKVAVVDDTTGAPVEGAKVTIGYNRSFLSLASNKKDSAITNASGTVILKANCLRSEPTLLGPRGDGFVPEEFAVHINTSVYQWNVSSNAKLIPFHKVKDRHESEVPVDPDVTMKIRGEPGKRVERQRKARLERQAERLDRTKPDYWPIAVKEPYPQAVNETAEMLVKKRWERASDSPLGSTKDVEGIRAAILAHMKHDNGEVGEIRWVNRLTVIASAGWYSGPEAAAGYKYVVRKRGGHWKVLTRYLDWIS